MEAWKQEELNNPTRSDYYLMQIAQMLYQSNRKGKAPQLDKFKIDFTPKTKRRGPVTAEERKRISELAKSRWLRMTGK